MWEKFRNVIVIALATLGVLFIIIMLIPDDDEDEVQESNTQQTVATEETEPETETEEEPSETTEAAAQETGDDSSSSESPAGGNTVAVNIPPNELSDGKISFKTLSLDNKEVTQDIFSDYDITVVHVWGTFCGPCIAEMGEYAQFYKEKPDNVNLIAIVCDVYDGIDSNVSDAKSILNSNGAEFINLRTSDDVRKLTDSFQYVPSSFFVDKEGHVIGSMMDGASFEETKNRLDTYLE
ncbi:MAG: TlpA family protein disulfide reductase [Lachnospiraceae bacterium]|nr:TlpA family protein disulfide reductase [Lachnospiraceae bacterium]